MCSSDLARSTDGLGAVCAELAAASAEARQLGRWLIEHHATDRRAVLTGATAYQELLSLVVATHLLVQAAVAPGASDRERARARMFTATLLARRPTEADVRLGDTTVDSALD